MDDLLLTCLLQALHTRVSDKDLPMTGTALWASAMLPCRPAGQHLDVKASTYKKLSKFLQVRCVLQSVLPVQVSCSFTRLV
jgi:translation initiation factor 2D